MRAGRTEPSGVAAVEVLLSQCSALPATVRSDDVLDVLPSLRQRVENRLAQWWWGPGSENWPCRARLLRCYTMPQPGRAVHRFGACVIALTLWPILVHSLKIAFSSTRSRRSR